MQRTKKILKNIALLIDSIGISWFVIIRMFSKQVITAVK